MEVTYFLNGPMFNLFFGHIVLNREKVISYEKSSRNLTFELQIVWKKNQRCNAIGRSIEMLKNS